MRKSTINTNNKLHQNYINILYKRPDLIEKLSSRMSAKYLSQDVQNDLQQGNVIDINKQDIGSLKKLLANIFPFYQYERYKDYPLDQLRDIVGQEWQRLGLDKIQAPTQIQTKQQTLHQNYIDKIRETNFGDGSSIIKDMQERQVSPDIREKFMKGLPINVDQLSREQLIPLLQAIAYTYQDSPYAEQIQSPKYPTEGQYGLRDMVQKYFAALGLDRIQAPKEPIQIDTIQESKQQQSIQEQQQTKQESKQTQQQQQTPIQEQQQTKQEQIQTKQQISKQKNKPKPKTLHQNYIDKLSEFPELIDTLNAMIQDGNLGRRLIQSFVNGKPIQLENITEGNKKILIKLFETALLGYVSEDYDNMQEDQLDEPLKQSLAQFGFDEIQEQNINDEPIIEEIKQQEQIQSQPIQEQIQQQQQQPQMKSKRNIPQRDAGSIMYVDKPLLHENYIDKLQNNPNLIDSLNEFIRDPATDGFKATKQSLRNGILINTTPLQKEQIAKILSVFGQSANLSQTKQELLAQLNQILSDNGLFGLQQNQSLRNIAKNRKQQDKQAQEALQQEETKEEQDEQDEYGQEGQDMADFLNQISDQSELSVQQRQKGPKSSITRIEVYDQLGINGLVNPNRSRRIEPIYNNNIETRSAINNDLLQEDDVQNQIDNIETRSQYIRRAREENAQRRQRQQQQQNRSISPGGKSVNNLMKEKQVKDDVRKAIKYIYTKTKNLDTKMKILDDINNLSAVELQKKYGRYVEFQQSETRQLQEDIQLLKQLKSSFLRNQVAFKSNQQKQSK